MKQYLVSFVTKKGGEEDHEMLIMAENAKHAVEVAKEIWYSNNTNYAFRMKAKYLPDVPDTEELVPEQPEDVPEILPSEISIHPTDIPFDMRIKNLCKKCKHLESCLNNDRSKVLEYVHCSEPCDDVCGECTACCGHFKQDFKEICVNCRSCIHFRKCLASDKVYWCHLYFDSPYLCFACETDDNIECIGKYLDCYQNEFEYFDYSELETEEVINDGDLPF